MKPSLDLTCVVESVDGSDSEAFTISADRDAEDQMFVGSFSNKLNVGFESFSGLLPRDFRKTYGSPRILQNLRVLDAGGNTVWEGRVDNVPPGRNNSVTAVGWYDALRDSSGVSEVYAMSDFGEWGDQSLNRRYYLASAGADTSEMTWTAGGGGMICTIPVESITSAARSGGGWYTAPPGVLIASADYTGNVTSNPAGWSANFESGNDDTAGLNTQSATLNGSAQSVTFTTPARYVEVFVGTSGTVTPTAGANHRYSAMTLYGDHGLSDIYASEVIKHAVGKYCPLITADSNSIYDTTYTIGHLVADGLTVDEVITRCNAFHLYELGVWADRTLWFQPQRDTTDYDYLLSIYEGDDLDVEGPRIEDDEPCNGVWVYYTSVTTGRRERVGPLGDSAPYDTDGDASLLVTDDENPCNREGVTRFPALDISFPCSSADAIQLGSLWLAEKQVPVSIGTGVAVGHVKNRAGAWVPAHNIKSGDRVKFTHEDVIRRVYSATYNPSSHSCSLAFERPPATFEGINERIQLNLQAGNVGR